MATASGPCGLGAGTCPGLDPALGFPAPCSLHADSSQGEWIRADERGPKFGDSELFFCFRSATTRGKVSVGAVEGWV